MKMKGLIFCLVLVLGIGCCFAPAFAYEDAAAEAVASQLSNTNTTQVSQGITYAPSSSYDNNMSIGSMPSAYGASAGLMDYRPGYLKEQAVEAPLGNLVKYGPKTITREMIETAKAGVVDRNGKQVYKKEIWENLVVRDGIYYKQFPADFPANIANQNIGKSNSIRQVMLKSFPPDAIQGVDYLWLGPVIAVSRSKDELIFVHNLRDAVVERAMDRGANGIIFEGQGADRDFKSGSLAANFWTALSQIFTNANPLGFAVTPGVGYQSGTTSEITKPYVGGIGIYIVNWEKFDRSPVQSNAGEQLEKEIAQTEEGLKKCKTYCMNNLTLRNRQGRNYLGRALSSRAAGNEQAALDALKTADYHFSMAEKNYAVVKNNKDDDQARAKELFNDSIYWRSGVIQVLQGKAAAVGYAQTHGLVRVPTFK